MLFNPKTDLAARTPELDLKKMYKPQWKCVQILPDTFCAGSRVCLLLSSRLRNGHRRQTTWKLVMSFYYMAEMHHVNTGHLKLCFVCFPARIRFSVRLTCTLSVTVYRQCTFALCPILWNLCLCMCFWLKCNNITYFFFFHSSHRKGY